MSIKTRPAALGNTQALKAPQPAEVARPATQPKPAAPAAPAGWKPAASTAAGPEAEQRLRQLNATLTAAQNNGKVGTAVANALTGGALGSAGRARDTAVNNVNQLHERLVARDGGRLSEKSARILNGAIDSAMESIKNVGEVRAGVISTTASLATSAVLVAAAVPSGGASIAALATIGAGTKAGLTVGMEGNNYTTARAAKDILSGAAEGAVAGVAAKAGKALSAAKPGATDVASRLKVLELLDNNALPTISSSELTALKATREALKQRVAAGLGTEAGAGMVSGNDKLLLRLLAQLDNPAILSRVR